LVRLADSIEWKAFEETFGALYCPDNGRPAKPIRLMVGLTYLKAMYTESDEELVEKWVENPYWQHFCGEKEFQHEFPIEPTTLGKWRDRVQAKGLEKLLQKTIETGLNTGVLKGVHLQKVNVDTTVQEKAIAYPTDARLYHRMREKLVKEAKALGVELRQTYTFKSKRAFLMQHRYRHARQMNRSRQKLRKLKTYFGRVLRDLDRKTQGMERSERLNRLLSMGYRLLAQQKGDSNKLYSLHAPEVECIAKGKAHKKYEFGCKVSVVTSSKGNFVLGALALHGAPYDGHTLSKALHQVHRLLPQEAQVQEAFVDAGYRGHGITQIPVHIVKRGLKQLKPSLRAWFKRRAAIEPIIGHMKNDGGPKRNHLLGQDGDQMNAILLACGFNLRKCLRALSFCLDWLTKIFRALTVELQLPLSVTS
jgi:IS5 family transposase